MTMTIEQIYREHQSAIFSFVNSCIHNIHDAEDVTQQVLIKTNRLLHTYDSNLSAFPTWLRNITKSVLIDFIRTNHQDRYKSVSDFVNSDGGNTYQFENPMKGDNIMEGDELRQRLVKAFRELKPEYRKVAVYYFFREYKYEEIAEKFKMKIGTVKGMISRCREMLKTELHDLHRIKAKMETV